MSSLHMPLAFASSPSRCLLRRYIPQRKSCRPPGSLSNAYRTLGAHAQLRK
ncbi:hypothetical protein CGRA01v4_01422 [Colletotrichum graminicola]|nr:hypothetical protein CGRA01v4_01422 [Colletotrichum graminicola]